MKDAQAGFPICCLPVLHDRLLLRIRYGEIFNRLQCSTTQNIEEDFFIQRRRRFRSPT